MHTMTVSVLGVLLIGFLQLSCVHGTQAAKFHRFRESSNSTDYRKIEGSNLVTLKNDVAELTIDLGKGCAVVGFADTTSHTNTINSEDLGREVQPSFYAGPSGYDDCVWNGQNWAWNPIGAGDCHGNPSKILSHSVSDDGSSMTCEIIPKQWACDNVDCECTFTISYTLQGNVVHGQTTLKNQRSDKSDYGVLDQEVPAVYVNGFLYRLFAYVGDNPWQDDTLTEFDAGFDNFWVPGKVDKVSENWMAFAAENDYALGVYQSSVNGLFLAGFSGAKGSGGASDSPTGYIAPIAELDVTADMVYTYDYVLAIGNLNDVRNIFYGLRNQEQEGKSLHDIFNQ